MRKNLLPKPFARNSLLSMKIVLDIETVHTPCLEWARVRGIELASPPGASSPDKTDLFSYAEYEDQLHKENEQYERSAFDGTFNRIVVIGVMEFSDLMIPQGAIAWFGEKEAELLRQFWERMGQLRPSLFITHNGLGFDLPFLETNRLFTK